MPQAESSRRACTDKSLVLTKATLSSARLLGLKQRELAKIIGISPSFISRMANGETCLPEGQKPWELSLLLVRFFRGLDALTGGDESISREWLRNYNTDLKCRPIDLISSIQGLVNVVDYVDAFRAKV